MEVKIENKIKLNGNQIIGVIDSKRCLLGYLRKINFTKNNITLNGKKLNQTELFELKKKISIIDCYILNDYWNLTVYEYMRYYIYVNLLNLKDYRKKIRDSLKIVGFDESYLDKKISYLSKSEQQWLSFATSLLSNPDILIFDHFFNSFDTRNIKKITRLIQQLVDHYHKVVIIYSTNSEVIYQLTNYTIILNDSEVLVEGSTNTIFQDHFDLLTMNNVSIPKTIEFSNKVNRYKGIKLGYFQDIRDLIKDIYKKV